jgi:hypothetical protein
MVFNSVLATWIPGNVKEICVSKFWIVSENEKAEIKTFWIWKICSYMDFQGYTQLDRMSLRLLRQ